MAFRYQAIDATGRSLADVIDASSVEEAAQSLRERGLFVTQLDADRQARKPDTGRPSLLARGRPRFRDVLLFTQQMSMLLRSGAQVIDALDAVEDQAVRPAWREVVAAIRLDVQEGRPLSAALGRFPHLFSGVYVSMITAGEASGELGIAFERLGRLTRRQQELRQRVIGAASYPLALLLLCGIVLTIMFAFILPRFAEMFETLDVDLPVTTAMLIAGSRWSQTHWPYLLVGLTAAVTGIVLFVRSDNGKRWLSMLSLRLPAVGPLVRNVILARICGIWGQLLQSRVGLMDAVELLQRGTGNFEFQALLSSISTSINQGNRIGPELKGSWLVPRTFAGAIATGEESGRLADALLFVGESLDDENAQMLNSLTRIIEPLILAVMGVVVGLIAFSLFIPMFDMATVAGQ